MTRDSGKGESRRGKKEVRREEADTAPMKKMKGEEQGKGFNEDNVVTKTGTYTSIQYTGQLLVTNALASHPGS